MYEIRKAQKETKISKSGIINKHMNETLPKLKPGESFMVPISDYKVPAEEVHKTVSAIWCIYVDHKAPNKKFKTHLDRDKGEILVTRVY